jgi:iron complex outermembrane receptor protein
VLAGGQFTTSEFESRDVKPFLNVLAATTPAYIDPAVVRTLSFYPVGLNPRENRRVALGTTWGTSASEIHTEQARVEATYRFELGRTRHNVVLGHTELSRSNARVSQGINFTRLDLFTYRAVDDTRYFRFDEAKAGSITKQEDIKARQSDAGTYLAYQGDFFSNRLYVVGGVRHDRSDARVIEYDFVTGGERVVTGSASGKPSTKTSPQAGLSFRLTPEISLFGLYSTGLTPNYDRYDGNRTPFAPTSAKSREFGVKIDLIKGRISGTISSYHIEREGVPYYVYWAPSNWRNLYNPAARESYQINFGRVYYTDDPADRAYIARIMAAQDDPKAPALTTASFRPLVRAAGPTIPPSTPARIVR